jgi:uncharacterized protein (TIGR03435 family)
MIGKVLAVGLVCAGMAMGQTASAPAASGAAATATPAKAYAFEVVSIRQNKTPPQMMRQQTGPPQFGPMPDGYRMTNMSMIVPIITAYVPQVAGSASYTPDQIKGLPDWLMTERYDIDARIGDDDRVEWQKPEAQKAMLQAMLQAMFAERCKLAVHREVKEVGVSSLVVAKGGVKFKETNPAMEHPDGMKLPWGGVMVPNKDAMNFYGTSMASFAATMSMFGNGGRPIQDKTGLTGKYDIAMKFTADMASAQNQQQSATAASDPGGSMIAPMLNDLGLKLESTKGQVETLVIDHMERPSEN